MLLYDDFPTQRKDARGGESSLLRTDTRATGGGPTGTVFRNCCMLPILCRFALVMLENRRSVHGFAVIAAWLLNMRCRLSGVAAPGLLADDLRNRTHDAVGRHAHTRKCNGRALT